MIISASTPDETRKAIVRYVEEQASYYRRQARTTHRKTVAISKHQLADNLDTIAKDLAAAPIEPIKEYSELLDAVANVRKQTGNDTVQVAVLRAALDDLEAKLTA